MNKLSSFILIPTSALLLMQGVAAAQSYEPFSPFSEICPSTEAWSMTARRNNAPSLYTGAMSWSVPVYTYSDPEFTLPISLDYIYDGYRPAVLSGTVGLGWHLECGGAITREVRGLPDDDKVYGPADRPQMGWFETVRAGYGEETMSSGLSFEQSVFSNTLCGVNPDRPTVLSSLNIFSQIPTYVRTTMNNGALTYLGSASYDMAPDIWHFSFLGHTGDFLMLPDGTFTIFNSDLPHGEITVEFTSAAGCRNHGQVSAPEFTIITGDGTRYIFGGFLYAMPRYTMSVPIDYADLSTQPVLTLNLTVTGYVADCDYAMSSDEIIGYGSVTETCPDGSRTVTSFSTWLTEGCGDLYPGVPECTAVSKKGIFIHTDGINLTGSALPSLSVAIPKSDRRGKRGRILTIMEYDGNGQLTRRTGNSYTDDSVSIPKLAWNDLDVFSFTPWDAVNSRVTATSVTEHSADGTSVQTTRSLSHNSLGQLTSESVTAGGVSISTHLKYTHEEDGEEDALPATLSRAARTRTAGDGIPYVTAFEMYEYDDPANASPSAITTKIIDNPVPITASSGGDIMSAVTSAVSNLQERTVSISYTTALRPSTVTGPGGSYVSYTWDGTHPVRKVVNSASNVWQYGWKDLVGLSSVTYPSGNGMSYGYDSGGRLSKVRTGDGTDIVWYHYNLVNE